VGADRGGPRESDQNDVSGLRLWTFDFVAVESFAAGAGAYRTTRNHGCQRAADGGNGSHCLAVLSTFPKVTGGTHFAQSSLCEFTDTS
jgi:hypothetical protein